MLCLLCKQTGCLLRLEVSLSSASVQQKHFNICSALSLRIMTFLSSKALKQMLKCKAAVTLKLSRCLPLKRQANILCQYLFSYS